VSARLGECAACRFWQPPKEPPPGGPGECRRQSPRAVQTKPDHWKSVWPRTWAQDWCGQFRPDTTESYELAGAVMLAEEPTDERA
jgi:hypothetical protein